MPFPSVLYREFGQEAKSVRRPDVRFRVGPAEIEQQPLRISDLPRCQNGARYELLAIEEPSESEELSNEEIPLEELPT
jgi:hypothetical protein